MSCCFSDTLCERCRTKVRHDASGALASPVRRMNGTTVYTGRVARIGVHQYLWGQARRDLKELEHLTRQLPGKPVVIYHPSRESGGKFIGGDRKQVGRIDSARVEDGFAIAQIIVDDQEAIDKIHSGVRELSLGYETDIIDGWDRNGRVDHLAFVDSARCGAQCSVRTDGSDSSGGGNAFMIQSMFRVKTNGRK